MKELFTPYNVFTMAIAVIIIYSLYRVLDDIVRFFKKVFSRNK